MSILDIIKVLGAFAAMTGTCYTIANSKRVLLKRLDRTERKIQETNNTIIRIYGMRRGVLHTKTHLDRRIERLEKEREGLLRLLN